MRWCLNGKKMAEDREGDTIIIWWSNGKVDKCFSPFDYLNDLIGCGDADGNEVEYWAITRMVLIEKVNTKFKKRKRDA